jgi:squalene-hopene/tetraprenyl-beta-curcumene cyclase
MLILTGQCLTAQSEEIHQYSEGSIRIPSASGEEPFLETWSKESAFIHLDKGAKAWTESKQCISCHTNGSYMMLRPSLTTINGPPDPSIRSFFVDELKSLELENVSTLRTGIQPTQLAYLAGGLASWDLHITGHCSEETKRALRLMFKAQSNDGSFGNDDCWPPLESSSFQAATVAAIAVASAPGWLKRMRSDPDLGPSIQKLEHYLKTTPPPHAYGQVLLLWTEHFWPGLVADHSTESMINYVREFQKDDGGWALRDFASPEKWGNGNRAEKLRSETTFEYPESDGHMTGLICMVLRLHSIPASDPTLEKGMTWLKNHQRVSGRWWTRSLNTDRYHFITYSSTCYALSALTLP